ncbi:NUDIX hydrolase [Treponema bryantii]|uniref:NUDIX hydrolase n=1 Tax=Treponema bryantii TaxID=163 RepID=UPI0004112A7C|nr:8-oxo-dGTP diphosphatase [Treponema bryantii]
MKTLINTSLCYIEKDNSYLMLHRTKKEHDYNKDKWIGIGGKFENGESPEDCAVREIREETGLVVEPADLEYCGIVTFVDVSEAEAYTEFMHIFRARKFSGELKSDCDEGDLEWVPLAKLKELPHWQADEIFYDFLAENHPFYSLKAVYKNNVLLETWLNGKPYDHFGG